MTRKLIFSISLIIFLPFFVLLSSQNSITSSNLHDYLPGRDDVKEWRRDGPPQEYKGEDLFLYINGGAEIYREYGFSQVLVQDYVSQKKKSISLEIFEMNSDESAFGMYTFKASPDGRAVELGDGAQLADYYLNFWKGKFLVTLTGFDEEEETREGLLKIARAVEAKVNAKGKIPPLVFLLPEEGLVKTSIIFFKGHLGLFNSYQFFSHDVFRLREGVRANYRQGCSTFIIKYPTDSECTERFGEAKESFKASDKFKDFMDIHRHLFRVVDRRENTIYISMFKNYLLIVLGSIGQDEAEVIFDSVQKNINSYTKSSG